MSRSDNTPLDVASGLNHLLTNLPAEVIILHSPAGQIHFASHSAPAVFGGKEKLGGTNFLDRLHPDDVERIRTLFMDAAARGIQPPPVTVRIMRSEQEDAWVVLFCVAVKDGTGRVIELHTTLRDVTQQIELRDRIVEHDKLSNMTNTLARVGGWYFDLDQENIFWSNEVRAIHEVDPDYKPTSASTADFFTEEDYAEVVAACNEAMSSVEPRAIEVPITTAKNTKRWIRVVVQGAVEDGEIRRLYGATQDVTEIKQREQELSDVVMELTSQRDQLEEFSHIMSHQLRSPITNLETLVSMLNESQTPKERTELQSALRDALDALRQTFDEVSSAVRLRYKEQAKDEKLIVNEVLGRVLDRMSTSLRDANATVTYNTDLCPVIDYPSVYLQAILQQLITNAIRFSDKTRPPHVEIQTLLEDEKQVITIRDNGAGIDLERFGPKMFKLRSTFHRHASGRGVGLFMVRTIVEALGGEIELDSRPGVGTTFKIYLHKHRGVVV